MFIFLNGRYYVKIIGVSNYNILKKIFVEKQI